MLTAPTERTVVGMVTRSGARNVWGPGAAGSIMSPFGFNPMCATWPRKKAAGTA